jgi:energy-coupling factor transporter ATP-binding protein EcfA2
MDDDIRVFLLGSALGALLHQRETFILHASAVIVDGEAVLFTGISGVGKSTTSTAFRLAGNPILTDDVCAILLNGKSKPIALPGYPQSKLWEDALEGLKMDYEDLKHIREKINKRAVPLKGNFHNEPMPIKAIYWLNTHNKEDILLEEVKGAKKFNTLKQMTYRPFLVDGLGVKPAHFKQGMQLAMQVPLKKITRPTTHFSVNELVDLVKEDLSKL